LQLGSSEEWGFGCGGISCIFVGGHI
jgi:hypothetical protein